MRITLFNYHLNEKQGKKSAIELGWKKSKGDVLFQTDADCVILRDGFN